MARDDGTSLAQRAWVPFWARVESKANIADGPSRGDFTEVLKLSAIWVDPMLLAWFSQLLVSH